MLYKLILKISEHGMDLGKLINCKTCAITLFIITVKQFFQGQKIRECGTQWEAVIKKWTKITKLNDAM
mgnify:FL=1